MDTSIITSVGNLGEYFAMEWLDKGGYEIRKYSALADVKYQGEDHFHPFLSEDETRKEEIRVLASKIGIKEHKIRKYEKSIPEWKKRVKSLFAPEYIALMSFDNDTLTKVRDQILTKEKEVVRKMREALDDLKSGRALAEINYPDNNLFDSRTRVHEVAFRREVEDADEQPKRAQEEARRFLGSKSDDFVGYHKEVGQMSHRGANRSRYPDLIAKKGDDFYLVEVKVNQSAIRPLQAKALRLATSFGFKTMVMRVRLDVSVRGISVDTI